MKKICILFMFSLLLPQLQAQEYLHIKNAFDKYAKEKGAVFVQLSKDILSKGDTRIRFYKSMIISDNRQKADWILNLIEADRTEPDDLRKSSSGNKITTLICQIKSGKTRENEYILYKNIDKKVSLVYIRGDFLPEELDQELNKLKDLFIYVKEKN